MGPSRDDSLFSVTQYRLGRVAPWWLPDHLRPLRRARHTYRNTRSPRVPEPAYPASRFISGAAGFGQMTLGTSNPAAVAPKTWTTASAAGIAVLTQEVLPTSANPTAAQVENGVGSIRRPAHARTLHGHRDRTLAASLDHTQTGANGLLPGIRDSACSGGAARSVPHPVRFLHILPSTGPWTPAVCRSGRLPCPHSEPQVTLGSVRNVELRNDPANSTPVAAL